MKRLILQAGFLKMSMIYFDYHKSDRHRNWINY
jgi:hypothetical protein